MDLELNNRHVVVIGGSKGIGLGISKSFLLEGAIVHIISRNFSEDVEVQFSKIDNARFYQYQVDVLILSDLLNISKLILERSNNKIDVLVSNVGSGLGVLDPIPNELDWNKSWGINFISALNSIRVFSEYISGNIASVLFISSIAGQEFIGAPISYSTAKSALISFSKTLSHKLAPKIRVNTISPGNIFFKGGTWEKKEKNNPLKVKNIINEKVPLNRFGSPEDIGNLAVFLSSNKASFITGSCIVIDGGQTIGF